MQDKELGKKSELQMGIEPMTFRTQVGCCTTEPRELIWQAYILSYTNKRIN